MFGKGSLAITFNRDFIKLNLSPTWRKKHAEMLSEIRQLLWDGDVFLTDVWTDDLITNTYYLTQTEIEDQHKMLFDREDPLVLG
jgi:hypothetical protein